MRIYSDSSRHPYPLVPAAPQDTVRLRVVRAPRGGEDTPPQGRTPLAAYVPEQPRMERVQGVSQHAQRAINAYQQHDQFAQRSVYTELLGVDDYA